jgi:hypothetical protein
MQGVEQSGMKCNDMNEQNYMPQYGGDLNKNKS